MNRNWILIFLIGLFFIGIVSAEGPTGIRPTVIEIKPAVTAVPVDIKEGIPEAVSEEEVTYINYGDIVESIIDKIKEIITPKPDTTKIDALVEATPPEILDTPQVVVSINGEEVAIIPKESKFNGMSVTTPCLTLGYGTDAWYKCEVYYANR